MIGPDDYPDRSVRQTSMIVDVGSGSPGSGKFLRRSTTSETRQEGCCCCYCCYKQWMMWGLQDNQK